MDATAVIANDPCRTAKHPSTGSSTANPHLIECCFSRLKQFRQAAARDEKTARRHLAVVALAATFLCLR